MALRKKTVTVVALPCFLVAAIGLWQYRLPGHGVANAVSDFVRRATANIPLTHPPNATYDGNPYWTQQNPEIAPPIPIFQLSEIFITAALNGSASYPELDDTFPVLPTNLTARNAHELADDHRHQHSRLHHDTILATSNPLAKRAAEPCAVGSPCPDGR
ncbi:MAG: hypothetical protein Q9222_006863 [Ikaeria aurantiellina]